MPHIVSKIWNAQKINKELVNQIVILTKEMYDYIISENRPVLNVTQWFKQEICWEYARKKTWTINKEFLLTLAPKVYSIQENEEVKKEQKHNQEFDVLKKIMQKGCDFWKRMLDSGKEKKAMSSMDEDFIRMEINLDSTGILPFERQRKIF